MLDVTASLLRKGRAFVEREYRRIVPSVSVAERLAKLPLPDDVIFVQIGSNDGEHGDPLHQLARERGWSGILVEPVPFVFERLQANCAGWTRFRAVNVAIAQAPGEMSFYYLDKAAGPALDLPIWYDQLGSFDRGHIIKELGEKVAPFIRSEPVNCITLTRLFEDNGITRLDLLHIDTEGYDFKILSQMNFTTLRPKVVIYESKHLAADERKAAQKLMRDNGYTIAHVEGDCFCTSG